MLTIEFLHRKDLKIMKCWLLLVKEQVSQETKEELIIQLVSYMIILESINKLLVSTKSSYKFVAQLLLLPSFS